MDQGIIFEQGTPSQIFEHPLKEATNFFVQKVRSLEYTIVRHDYDIYDLNQSLKNFCIKHYLKSCYILNLQLLVEELINVKLIQKLSKELDINLVVSYLETTRKVIMTITWPGKFLDINKRKTRTISHPESSATLFRLIVIPSKTVKIPLFWNC